MSDSNSLRRAISLPLLILYGVGNMVGAGFYALLGQIAGLAGSHAPLALFLSALIAYACAFSFSELCARYPVSAGPSRYVAEAFGSRWLPRLVGLMVVTTGVVSAATICTAFNLFLQEIFPLPPAAVIASIVLLLGTIAVWGIRESIYFSGLITVITVAGLVYVLAVTLPAAMTSPLLASSCLPPSRLEVWQGIIAGSFLGFYAFIGFEDLVCNAEEIENVQHTIAPGIFASVTITMALYVLVALAAICTVPPDRLAASPAPLAALLSGGGSRALLLVSLVAGINGALTQIIMASRMIYGMACEGNAPQWLSAINPSTRTPLRATALMTAIVMVLALCLPMITLAKTTCMVMLLIFALVNLSLWKLKKEARLPVGEGPGYPGWLAMIGFLLCILMLAVQTGSEIMQLPG